MKTCPKKCGTYSDVETRCPVCGARLYRFNSTSPQNAVNNTNGNASTQSSTQVNFGGQNNSNIKMTQASSPNTSMGNSNIVLSNNNTTVSNNAGFHYNIQKFTPQANSAVGGKPNTAFKQSNIPTVTPSSYPATSSSPGCIRGRVINKMEISRPQSKLAAVFNGFSQGGISFSNTVTNFDVIGLDVNNKQTGNDRTVCFRGDINYGSFNDGDIVQVKGKLDRGGCLFAKSIYNESKKCEVKVAGQISGIVPLILVALAIFLVILVMSNIDLVTEAITSLVLLIAVLAIGKRYIGRGGRGLF